MRAKSAYDSEYAYYEEREAHMRELELENSAIYQEFNVQLDAFVNNLSLSQDDDWTAMVNDAARAQLEAQRLQHENG